MLWFVLRFPLRTFRDKLAEGIGNEEVMFDAEEEGQPPFFVHLPQDLRSELKVRSDSSGEVFEEK